MDQVVAERVEECEEGKTPLLLIVIRLSLRPVKPPNLGPCMIPCPVAIVPSTMMTITGCPNPELVVIMIPYKPSVKISLSFVHKLLYKFILLSTTTFIHIHQPTVMETT